MIKIVAITLIFACIIIYLRSINSELALLATVGASVIILTYVVSYLSQTVEFFNKIIELTGIDKGLYKIIFKITAIGYLVEFGATTLSDFGLNSLSNKLLFVGKIVIFSVSLPIIYAVFNLLIGLLQ
jgi:stage III sporulation protein AD